MAAVVALIFIVVALISIGMIFSAQEDIAPQDYRGNFPVDDPSIDQICDTDEYFMTGITVIQTLNDGTTLTIPAGNWTYSGDTVIIDNSVVWGR